LLPCALVKDLVNRTADDETTAWSTLLETSETSRKNIYTKPSVPFKSSFVTFLLDALLCLPRPIVN